MQTDGGFGEGDSLALQLTITTRNERIDKRQKTRGRGAD